MSVTMLNLDNNFCAIILVLSESTCGLVVDYSVGLATDRSRVRLMASRFQVTTLGKLFAYTRLCHQAVNLVPVKGRWWPAAGEATVGRASHWPCVTDFSGLSTYGLAERVMSTLPTFLMEYGTLQTVNSSWLQTGMFCLLVSVWSCTFVPVWRHTSGLGRASTSPALVYRQIVCCSTHIQHIRWQKFRCRGVSCLE